MTNYGLEKALAGMAIPFARANVGDRYVMEMMRENNWDLGGESSGHIICTDITTTGDGIVAALQVLCACVQLESSLSEVLGGYDKYPQHMINVRHNGSADIANPRINEAVASAEAELGDSGRVLLRASGTEPLIRVMAEGADGDQVERLVAELADQVRQIVG